MHNISLHMDIHMHIEVTQRVMENYKEEAENWIM